jgi:hypothetical protein
MLTPEYLKGSNEKIHRFIAEFHNVALPPGGYCSWSNLMAGVVPCIESLRWETNNSFGKDNCFVVSIETGYVLISENGEAPVVEKLFDTDTDSKLEAVYTACVDFINQYFIAKEETQFYIHR